MGWIYWFCIVQQNNPLDWKEEVRAPKCRFSENNPRKPILQWFNGPFFHLVSTFTCTSLLIFPFSLCSGWGFMFDTQQHYFIWGSSGFAVKTPHAHATRAFEPAFEFVKMHGLCSARAARQDRFWTTVTPIWSHWLELNSVKRAADWQVFADTPALLSPAATLLHISYLPACFCVTLLKSCGEIFSGLFFFFFYCPPPRTTTMSI